MFYASMLPACLLRREHGVLWNLVHVLAPDTRGQVRGRHTLLVSMGAAANSRAACTACAAATLQHRRQQIQCALLAWRERRRNRLAGVGAASRTVRVVGRRAAPIPART